MRALAVILALCFALSWTVSSPALAVELDTSEPLAAPVFSLTVTAPRWIASGDVKALDLEALEAAGAVTVADALRMTPDIVILQYGRLGSPQRVGIRGTGASQALILLDGAPVPTGSHAALFEIPLSDIDRIEIVKAQGLSLLSDGAIYIRTKAANADAASFAQSSGRFPEWDLLVTESGAVGETEFLLTAYHATLPFGLAGESDRQRYVRVRLDRDMAEGARASANLAWSLSERGTTPGSTSAWNSPAADASGYDDVVVANVAYESRLGQGALKARGFAHLANEDLDPLGRRSGKNDLVVGAEIQATMELGASELVVGAGARRESARGGELDGDGVVFDFATLFAKLTRPLGTRAQVSVGAQADRYAAFRPVVSPSLVVAVQPLPQTVLKASALHAFRPPSLSDWRAQAGGSSDLLPEQGWRYELGLAQSLGWGSVGVDLFREELTDRIYRRPDAAGGTRSENLSETVTQGVDLTVGAPLGKALSASVRLRLVDDRNGNGERLPYVASQEMRLGLQYQGSSTQGNVELQLLGSRTDETGAPLAPLAVANGRIVHAAGRNIDLFAEGYNLFDAQDAKGALGGFPGRTIIFGASLNF